MKAYAIIVDLLSYYLDLMYKKETLPLVEYYKKKGRFFNINATANKEKVIEEIDLIAKRI